MSSFGDAVVPLNYVTAAVFCYFVYKNFIILIGFVLQVVLGTSTTFAKLKGYKQFFVTPVPENDDCFFCDSRLFILCARYCGYMSPSNIILVAFITKYAL